MPANPYLPGGGSGSSNPYGGGGTSGGSSPKTKPLSKAQINKIVRNAIASGDTRTVDRGARAMGVSNKDRKNLIAVAKSLGGNSFVDRLGNDVSDTFANLPRGVFNTAAAAATEVSALPRVGYKVATGQPVSTDEAIGAIPGIGNAYNISRGFVEGGPNSGNPLSSGIGSSFRHTANRATDPSQLIRDYSTHPFSTAVEDAGNLAVVAGGASRLARLGGLEKTANFLETGSKAAQTVSNTPFLPVSPLARGANKALLGASEHLAESRFRPAIEAIGQSPAQRAARTILRTGEERQGSLANQVVREYAHPAERLLPHKAEQEALYTVGTGQADALAAIRRAAPETFKVFVKNNAAKLDNISVKGAELAADYAERRSPALTARIDEALKVTEPARLERQAGALQRGLNPEQLGHAPLSETVDRAVAKPAKEAAAAAEHAAKLRAIADQAAQKVADVRADESARLNQVNESPLGGSAPTQQRAGASSGKRVGEAEQRAKFIERRAAAAERHAQVAASKVDTVRANTEASIEAAPARLRPVLESNRAAVSHLTSIENDLRGRGLHEQAAQVGQAAGQIPTTLAALQDAGVDPEHFIRTVERDAKGVGAPGMGGRQKKLGEGRFRTGRGQGVRTIQAQTTAEIKRAQEVIHNETVTQLENAPFAKTAGEVVGKDLTTPTLKELADAGYVPLDPAKALDVSTKVVPKAVGDMVHSYFKSDGAFEKVIQHTYDPVTRAFKTIVLPLSPSWQVGNMIGNTFMATFLGGVGPASLLKNMVKSIREYKATGQFSGPERLFSSGATHETLDYQRTGNYGSPTGVRRLSPVRLGYKGNQVVDDLLRSAVYLAKKGKGYSDEMALRQSLRAMGDFTNLSPFERRVVRRIIPFYAWQKHLTQLAFRMPIEHPLRTAWTLSLANSFGDGEAWESLLPPYLRGTIDVGGGNVLAPSSFFPFSNPAQAITDPGSILQNLNPIIKIPLENKFGVSTLTGKPFTRPPGTGRQDASGNILPTAPSIKEQLLNISPQVRAYRNLSGYNNVARYQSGDVVRFRGDDGKLHTIPTEVNDTTSLLKFLGLSIKSKSSLKQIADSIIKKKVANFKLANPKKNTKPPSKSKSSNPLLGG